MIDAHHTSTTICFTNCEGSIHATVSRDMVIFAFRPDGEDEITQEIYMPAHKFEWVIEQYREQLAPKSAWVNKQLARMSALQGE